MSNMKMLCKPPLPRSPVWLRSRRALQPTSNLLQTPPGSLTKSQKPIRSRGIQEPKFLPISCELQPLAKMANKEIGDAADPLMAAFTCLGSASVLERGRFYDEYAARRNERLKRKKGEELGETKKAGSYDLGVTVESSKRRDSKKLEGLKKSVAVAYSAEMISQTPRYMLRSSSKGNNKKPPLPVASSSMKSAMGSERRLGTRRTGRI